MCEDAQRIRVCVLLHGHLPWYAPGEKAGHCLSLPAGSTAESVLGALGVLRTEVLAFSVAGCQVSGDHRLEDHDRLEVIPVVSGG